MRSPSSCTGWKSRAAGCEASTLLASVQCVGVEFNALRIGDLPFIFLLQLIVDQGYQCTAEWYRAGHCSACPYVLARLAMARGKRLDPSAVGGRIRGPLPGHRAVCCQSRKRLLRAGQGLPLAARASIALRHAGYGGPIPTCTYEATANPGVIRLVL